MLQHDVLEDVSVSERQILYDPIYMKCWEQSDRRQNVEQWWPGAGVAEMDGYCLVAAEFQFYKMRFMEYMVGMAAQHYKCI